MSEQQQWKHERPSWCPHGDCEFLRRAQDALCGGHLPASIPHDGDANTHRLCFRADGTVFDLQVNHGDLWWLRRVCDALDGRHTADYRP